MYIHMYVLAAYVLFNCNGIWMAKCYLELPVAALQSLLSAVLVAVALRCSARSIAYKYACKSSALLCCVCLLNKETSRLQVPARHITVICLVHIRTYIYTYIQYIVLTCTCS
ncbi:unnamed protein product [Ceratitis capitata]|uniref:(Mediterranean fruit fly) hypothetical protein n=1 Tax=Ceratitis capitata TaxID=7213 RepID=A0A811VJ79_CERCA|nr:unnamed protein product [Ceratitis capitata]